ncbi:low temperature requirement protein A [Marinobacter sp. NP-4(2019)]|uniref:low temperature requirement protein A n=1 Tax=Marinobacter sp. NP-4(2019) TaxID=2488665 RepID=UPI000FC3DFA0|nr:low temperature requirement protein A [Marinobacter sp. NP-4(2019)]AZT83816.1 low temperature requirement protein A [Marinobacter sp. NP-4(2019)]
MTPSFLHWIVPTGALRKLEGEEAPHVTNMELFFDLVYVFSIIQLSHYLLAHQTAIGALEAFTLFAAVWWSWNYTAWATNWVNPDHLSGRILMIALMACALAMAIAMPSAFTAKAGLFVGAYVVMALLRAFYMALVFRGSRMGRNYAQLGLWSALSSVFWIAGAAFAECRLILWVIAVLVDYAAPYFGFWLPRLGATPMATWPLRGLHLLERNQQVFIIALGESILLLGGLLSHQTLTPATVLAAVLGFLMIVSLWWLYFVHATETGERRFSSASDHTRLARAGLAYAHGIMVCGAITMAVAIEEIVAHPTAAVHLPAVIIAIAGPTLYLVGGMVFFRVMAQRVPWVYGVATALLMVIGYLAIALHLSGLVLGGGILLILLMLATVMQLECEKEG